MGREKHVVLLSCSRKSNPKNAAVLPTLKRSYWFVSLSLSLSRSHCLVNRKVQPFHPISLPLQPGGASAVANEDDFHPFAADVFLPSCPARLKLRPSQVSKVWHTRKEKLLSWLALAWTFPKNRHAYIRNISQYITIYHNIQNHNITIYNIL